MGLWAQERERLLRGPGALAALAGEAAPLMPDFTANARRLYRNLMAVPRN